MNIVKKKLYIMRIELNILNNEVTNEETKEHPTYHIRKKIYEFDNYVTMDDDIKNSTMGHKLDRLILDDVEIISKYGITELIEFLEKAKGSFEY